METCKKSEVASNNKRSKRKLDAVVEEQKKILKPFSINQYNGWVVPEKNYTIPKIQIKNLTKEIFFDEYVRKRRPVVLEGNLDGLDGLEKWQNNNDHLRKLAGEEKVMVEVRKESYESFGRGNEISMSFGKFLDLVESGDEKHYLTTQDVEANEDGQPDLMAPFMKALKDDFPLRLDLAGNLIPQNINLWMGNNNNGNGVSSGLHHDYHDNLYIIVRGRKRFRLYSPKDTENLYPKGNLLKVHPNGRVNYEGEETTAFGTDLLSDAAAKAAKAKEMAEQKLLEAERALEEGRPGAEKEVQEAERMLEEAMDTLIDIEMDNDDDISDDDNYNERLELEDDPEEILENDDNFENDDASEEKFNNSRLIDKTVKDPNNFSKISPSDLSNSEGLKKEFPDFGNATPAFCDLRKGEILYLPASWWHEVTSYGGKEGHLAVNYWFHPPDGKKFKSPYTSDFWQNDFDSRV